MPTTQAKKNTPDASQAHNDIQLIFEGGCATVPLSPCVVQCEMSGNYSRTGGNCFWWSKLRPRHCNGARFCINVAPGVKLHLTRIEKGAANVREQPDDAAEEMHFRIEIVVNSSSKPTACTSLLCWPLPLQSSFLSLKNNVLLQEKEGDASVAEKTPAALRIFWEPILFHFWIAKTLKEMIT